MSEHAVAYRQSGMAKWMGSRDFTHMSVKAGHIGLSVGSRAHKELWPKATAWMAERSEPVDAG